MKKIICLGLILLNITVAVSQSKKVETFSQDFVGAVIWKVNGSELPIIKWEGKDTLSYYLKGNIPFMSNNKLNTIIGQIEKLTNIKMIATNDSIRYNILIYIGTLADYFKFIDQSYLISNTSNFKSWSNRQFNKNKQLIRSTFCITPEIIKDPSSSSYYIQNMLIKSMGILGNSNFEYSIFYNGFKGGNGTMNADDKRIVKAFYNLKIKAGMTSEQVRRVLLDSLDLEQFLKEKP